MAIGYRVETEGKEPMCGQCPKCTSREVDKLTNGRCHCRSCAHTWTPPKSNYTIEQSR